MKKITSLFAVFAMLATLIVIPVSAETDYAGGDGLTAETAFEIATAEQLAYAATKINDGTDNTKYFKLTADIDYNSQEWVPMGTSTNSFKGNFDGQGHVVKNLNITVGCDYVGFFGLINTGGVVKNLGIDNMYLAISDMNPITVGGFASYVQGATITDCYLKNSNVRCGGKRVQNAIGVFAGVVRNNSVVKNCYVYNIATISQGENNNAGFTHQMLGGGSTFENCYVAAVTVSYNRSTYSFGSDSKSDVTATNCWSTLAAIKGTNYKDELAFGNYVETQAELVSKFEDVEGFDVVADINAGYPCLAWEVPAVVVTPTPTPTATPTPTPTATPTPEPTDNPLYDYGYGTEERPYEIATAQQLANASEQINAGIDNKAYFKLTADIDYNGQEWVPMGNATNYFQGNFDGQGHVIKNFAITGTTTYDVLGLFGYVGFDSSNQTVIKNIGIENANIYFNGKTANYVGGMVGYVHAYTTIENCYVKNSTVGYAGNYEAIGGLAIGGFAGMVRNLHGASTNTTAPVIKNCYVYGVTFRQAADRELSGFAGVMYDSYAGKFINCYVADVKYHANFVKAENASGAKSTVYGFLNNLGYTGIEVSNCYSTLAGGQGSSTTYSDAKASGNVGASKADVVNVFKNVAGFATSPAVNGGYPCFANEVPFVVTSVGSDGAVKITRKAGVTTPAFVYVATYDANDRFVDVKAAVVNEDNFSFTPDGLTLAQTLKVFVWDGNNNPLTYAK